MNCCTISMRFWWLIYHLYVYIFYFAFPLFTGNSEKARRQRIILSFHLIYFAIYHGLIEYTISYSKFSKKYNNTILHQLLVIKCCFNYHCVIPIYFVHLLKEIFQYAAYINSNIIVNLRDKVCFVFTYWNINIGFNVLK